jgi:membrane fusion protein (multidrug efflux system)
MTRNDAHETSALTLDGCREPRVHVATSEPGAVNGDPRRRSGLTRVLVLGVVALATIAGLLAGTSWGTYRLEHTVVSNASVKGRVYRIGARVDGQIRSVEVQPGQRVVKDQVLIQLVDDHYQATARQARAELQAALKRLEVEKLAIAQERRRLTAEVERAEGGCDAAEGVLEAAASTREKWDREFARIMALTKSGVASTSEVDTVTAERDNARAAFKAAQGHQFSASSVCQLARLQVEGLRVREAGLEVMNAEVELARQRVAVCETDVAAAVIRAPADGWVVERIVEPGGSAKVGDPMMSLWLGTPWIEAWVDEKKISRIKVGSAVDVTFAAYPGRKLRGKVESFGVLADKELRNSPVPALHSLLSDNAKIPVRISVPDDQLRLQPGLSAVVGIRDARPEPAATTAGRSGAWWRCLPLGWAKGQPAP